MFLARIIVLSVSLYSCFSLAQVSPEEEAVISALGNAEDIELYEAAISNQFSTAASQAKAFWLVGFRWEALNNMDRAFDAYDKSVGLLEGLPPSAELVYSLSDRSYIVYRRTGDPAKFCPDRQRALRSAREVGEPAPLVHALVRLSFCYESSEGFKQGLNILQEAMQVAQDHQLQKNTLAMVANASGNIYRANQLHDRAYSAYRDAYRLWLAVEDVPDYFNMLHNMVEQAIELGHWAAARDHVEEMFAIAQQHPVNNGYAFFANYNKGGLALAEGEYPNAELAFTAALNLHDTTPEKHFVSEAFLRRAETRVWLANFTGARHDLELFHGTNVEASTRRERLARLNQALINNDGSEIVAVMLEIRRREAKKRYAFIDANTRLFTQEHEERVSVYETSLLKQKLALQDLELSRAQDRARLARQSTTNLALLTLMLFGLIVWLIHSLRQHRALARTDFLTGIATRGHVFERGFSLCEKAEKRGMPLAVILFDIDNFKCINDSFGHSAGDRAIQETVNAARSTLGRRDIMGRLGGEEFVVILPSCDKEQANARAEAIRMAVATAGFMHAGDHRVEFTISLGVAYLLPGLDFQALVNQADHALYKAKNAGRNCVKMAEESDAKAGQPGVVGSRKIPRS